MITLPKDSPKKKKNCYLENLEFLFRFSEGILNFMANS